MASTSRGYGYFSIGGKRNPAHRVAYELSGKTIPLGFDLDHVCHVRRCVRPSHLRPATRKQNLENLTGARQKSKSGVRGVYQLPTGRWWAMVCHYGETFYAGTFNTVSEAEEAVTAKRCELFTHNDADR
jgi:hypothetical protein